jgi:uroporphyrinogen decarboxylase
MTRRERVREAVSHHRPDRVPWSIGLTIPAAAKVAAKVGCAPAELAEWMGNHIYMVEPLAADAWQEIKPGYWRDECGVVWNRTVDPDIGVIEEFQLDRPSIGSYRFPDPDAPARWEGFEAGLAKAGDRFRSCGIGFSLFERAWTLRGMPNLLMDMVEAPEFVDELLDTICDYNIRLVERAVHYDIDAIHFGDDWGQQHGLIMGPRHWRRFIKPRIERMYGAAKRLGKRVIIHSCGDVDELFPDLIAAGLDVFTPFQPEVMDIQGVKAQFGDRLTFWGGMSIQKIMPFGSVEDVRQEAFRLMEQMGQGGGYILAPSHDIPWDVPVENILALVHVARDEQ